MPRKKEVIPDYKSVIHNGKEYYRTRIMDADGKRELLFMAKRRKNCMIK